VGGDRSGALPDDPGHDCFDLTVTRALWNRHRHDRDLRITDAPGWKSPRSRPRHLDRALQHGLRTGGRGPCDDLLPAFPVESRRDADRYRAAGDQAGGNHSRRAPGMWLRTRAYREEPEINFIPLIDVLLVILIFLMVTTTYSRYAELQINLPTAE